jgi:hypothetical protein
VKEGRMFDTYSLLATLLAVSAALAALSLVLSRIIPDDYDNRVPARRRIEPDRRPRARR